MGTNASSSGNHETSISSTDSQPAQGSVYVVSISVDGNRLVSDGDILDRVKTKSGDPFDRDALLQDLKSINAMGYFYPWSLTVTPCRAGVGGVKVQIHVQENSPVDGFELHGNHVISSDEIDSLFNDQ